jgi:nitrous oxide reductase accessory protein NosL
LTHNAPHRRRILGQGGSMRIVKALAVIATGATLAGCAPTMDATRPSPFDTTATRKVCNTQVCEMPVRISAECVVSSGAWEQILLDSGPTGPRKLVWTIVTDGFRFSEEPAAFAFFVKSGDASKLRNVRVSGNGKKLEIDFQRDGRGTWLRYGMHVRRESGAFCPALDPWILD